MKIPFRFLWSGALSGIILLAGSAAHASVPESGTQPPQTSTTTVSVSTVALHVPMTDLDQAQDLLGQGKNKEAASLFEHILASSPTASGALEGLGEAQLALGDISGAQESAGKILDQNKEDAAGWVLLARAAYARGNYGKTLSLCNKALKYEPHYSLAYFWRGKAYEARGEADEAKNEYHAATLCNQR